MVTTMAHNRKQCEQQWHTIQRASGKILTIGLSYPLSIKIIIIIINRKQYKQQWHTIENNAKQLQNNKKIHEKKMAILITMEKNKIVACSFTSMDGNW